MARRSKLDEMSELRQQFAEAYVEGATRKELAQAFAVSIPTITTWTHDQQVQAIVSRLRAERINRITRKIDAKLEKLVDAEGVKDPKLLLDIRKTLAPTPVNQNLNLSGGVSSDEATAALWKKLSEHPELAAALLGAAALPPGDESEDG